MVQKTSVSKRRPAHVGSAALVLACSLMLPVLGHAKPPSTQITIGTGGATGVYYPAGAALCKLINNGESQHGIHCTAQTSAGSVVNAQGVRAGTYDFGVVQSDVQFYAMKGYGPFKKDGPDKKLRAVISLHPEPFTLIARADAGIRSLDDLKGKRVNIGNPGSGQRTSMELLMHAKGWTKDVFASTFELPSNEQSAALCENKIDAMVMTVGHPNPDLKNTITSCNAVLVDVKGPAIQQVIKKYPYYSAMTIPGRAYPGSSLSVHTFGVNATLVTSSDTPNRVVMELLHGVFNYFTDFKFSHPAFFSLVPSEMSEKGLTAPLHPAAQKYFDSLSDLNKLLKIRPPRGR